MNTFSKPIPDSRSPLVIVSEPRPIVGRDGPEEEPNSLKSSQSARVVDLLGEGPIVGPWNGLKSIYYDGVPIQRDDGGYNFENFTIAGVAGYGNQPVLKGFPTQQNEKPVNIQVKKGFSTPMRISDATVDRCRITVSVPALMQTMPKGSIWGSTIDWKIWLQKNNAGYNVVKADTIEGKTNTRYQRQMIITLNGSAPWDIKLERITDDSEDVKLQNELWWDSYTEITDRKINYTLSAVMAHTVRAEDFDSIPKRVYDVGGLLIQYPSNYNPTTRKYTGTWDGTFVTGYCNNPVWVFYDILVENRYGLGDFIKGQTNPSNQGDIDVYELYSIAKWCDGEIKLSPTKSEPRWVFNGVINTRQEAYDLLANIASVWRGSAFWAGGKLVASCDQPSDPVFLFTNANVIDGTFHYQGADRRARHNQVAVAWSDPDNLGERRLAIVEDRTAISKNGVQKTDIVAMGCTSETQALRVGDWLIYTENYESETISFTAGLEGAYVRPGNIASVLDVMVSGSRRSGRIAAITKDNVTLDGPVTLKTGMRYFLSCVKPSGTIITVGVSGTREVPISVLNVGGDFGTPLPNPDTIWALSSDDLDPTLWRIVSAKQTEKDRYAITGVLHNPDKWAYVERDRKLTQPDISNIGGIPGINGTKFTEWMYEISRISVGVKLMCSWDSKAPYFDVDWRERNGHWHRLRAITQHSIEFDVQEQKYDVWITPRNQLGKRGQTTKATYEVIGRTAAPKVVENFRIQNIKGIALLQWKVSDEIDVLIGGSYEVRYSPRTNGSATWASSNKIITAIPGSATTAEVPYRPGTYLIKRKDITGLMSPVASRIANAPRGKMALDAPDAPSPSSVLLYQRITEHPTFLGTKDRTTILAPQNWLVLSGTNLEGYYFFKNQIDMGVVTPVTLTVDMFAFPYIAGTGFIDARTDLIDTWEDFDSANDDGDGMVVIRYRQTDSDPVNVAAIWTDWQQFIAGEYLGRGFQFQAWLAAPEGQNVGIEELSVIAEIDEKQDHADNVTWVPNSMNITFAVQFFAKPAIAINIDNAATGDYYKITNKSKTGFTLTLYNSSNAVITAARTFDWIATGN